VGLTPVSVASRRAGAVAAPKVERDLGSFAGLGEYIVTGTASGSIAYAYLPVESAGFGTKVDVELFGESTRRGRAYPAVRPEERARADVNRSAFGGLTPVPPLPINGLRPNH
jgi:hypothetical protein